MHVNCTHECASLGRGLRPSTLLILYLFVHEFSLFALYTPTFSFYYVRVKDITRVLQHIPRLKNKNSCTIKIFSLCRIIGIMHERIIIEIIFGTSIFRENGLVGKFIIKSYYLSYNIIRWNEMRKRIFSLSLSYFDSKLTLLMTS